MTEDAKKIIDEINSERKQEIELLNFKKKQDEVAKSIKMVYDSYIEQGFTSESATYLTAVAYQSCFSK